jgi:tetratricopeptide (TPR) repeat protein
MNSLGRGGRKLCELGCLLSLTVGCGASRVSPASSSKRAIGAEQTGPKLVERGKLFARVGDLTRAAQYLRAATARGADERDVLPLLMEVYVRSGRYRLAIEHGERRLAAHPDDLRLRFLVGALHAAVEDYPRAAYHLQRLLSRAPAHAAAHYALAVLLRDHQDDAVGADCHFRRYLQLQPAGPHAAAARASLLSEVP